MRNCFSLSGSVSQSVQSLSRVRLSATPWIAACQASLSITNSQSSLRLTSIKSVKPSNHLILCHPLLLLPSVFPRIRVFSNDSVLLISWSKYWSFSFSISPSNEYSGLISFRMGWLVLLVAQGTPKSLLQHHSSKASVLQRLAFCIVQLSHPYMTPGKTIVLTRGTFVSKVRLTEFCQENSLVIANTLFQQHKRRLYTWTSPDGQHQNQTDYILCTKDGEALYSQQKQEQELTVA